MSPSHNFTVSCSFNSIFAIEFEIFFLVIPKVLHHNLRICLWVLCSEDRDFVVKTLVSRWMMILYFICRMGMKCFSGSNEALNWRSLWTHIVIASLWSWIQLPSCLMVAVYEQSRRLMRSLSLLSHLHNLHVSPHTHTAIHLEPHVYTVTHVFCRMMNCLYCFLVSAGNGGWWWDWCNASSNWRSRTDLILYALIGRKLLLWWRPLCSMDLGFQALGFLVLYKNFCSSILIK